MTALVLALATAAAVANTGSADETLGSDLAPLITVSGILPNTLADVAGSAHTIDAATLTQMQPIALKDVLRRAPGIQVIDEDALGLKLNISVRGLNARRSGRTLLLEDGAPLQPAPYADPSAHHYPSLGRVERVEFRKGSGQILFGPQSIGGMINFITAPVPRASLLSGSVAAGGRGFARLQFAAGLGNQHQGARLDVNATTSPGIRDEHRSQAGEIALKARTDIGADQAVTFKAAYLTEYSKLTESGLTEQRFAANPYANPFAHDVFRLNRLSGQIVHEWLLSAAQLTTQAYYADTYRASYRQTDTATDVMTANPANGCISEVRTAYETGAGLCGNKQRPRRFRFWGVETRLDAGYSIGTITGTLQLGARQHHETTRRQRYNGLTPDARETSTGTMLRDDNEITTDATALHAQNILRLGRASLTAGLRVEDITTRNRATAANFVLTDITARSRQRVALPGAGVTWGDDTLSLFTGIHRGFAPARPDRDLDPLRIANPVRPERSTEIEVGLRSQFHPALAVGATLFSMNLNDLIVEGPLVGGRSGSFVNAGTARHRGIEISAKAHYGAAYTSVAYTWLAEARFTSDVGDNSKGVLGNRIPYTPEHQIDVTVGMDTEFGLAGEIGINHVSRQFANADNRIAPSADGQSGTIPARTLTRAVLRYSVPRRRWQLFASVENLLDNQYISSRIDGLFAGQRRQWIVGIRAAN